MRLRWSQNCALFAASSLSLVTLTGCPLSDEYSIDSSYGSGGSGGSYDASRGGASGATASSAGQSASGGAADACSAVTCKGACCGDKCSDLATDPSNCGQCGNVCSAGRSCSVGACASGWLPVAPPPPAFAPREKAAYAAFSGKLFVFGGLDADGDELDSSAIYDPALDTWQLGAVDGNTPSARELATAVWTGSSILVFGGRNEGGQTLLSDAALFDPVANRWSKAASNATARAAAAASVSDGVALFWSGLGATLLPLGGADTYRVSTDSWAATPTTNAPPRLGHTAYACVGSSFFVYGGIDSNIMKSDKSYRYSFASNSWSTLMRGPSARFDAFGASDGTHFYVWGGRDDNALKPDGGAYDSQWAPLGTKGAPAARYAPVRESGWSFSLDGVGFALLGGFNGNGDILHDGARYSTASDDWSRIAPWSVDEDHAYGAAVYTGKEIIVFGGRDGERLTNTGERYAF